MDTSTTTPVREDADSRLANRGTNWSAIAACALTAVAISPMLAAVATSAGDPLVPLADVAIFDLRVRDVFSTNPPLVGPFGEGWNHPGPIVYSIPALVGAPFGWPAWATVVGGALVQASAIVWLAIAAWRRGRLGLVAVWLGGLGLAYSVQGPWVITDPWNPHLAYPFFALFVFQVWAIGEGSAWTWVGIAVTGSFLVQTHIGYAPLVLVGTAFAAACSSLRRPRRTELSRALAIALVVGAVLWLPPLAEQVGESPGNLSQLVEYFSESDDHAIGVARGSELLATEFQLPPPWLEGPGPSLDPVVAGASAAWLLLPTGLVVVAAAFARRRRDARAGRLVALVALMLAAGVLALGQLSVDATWWRIMWRTPLAVFVVVATGFVLTGAARRPLRDRLRAVGVVTLAAAVPIGYGALALDVLRFDHGATPGPELFEELDEIDGSVMAVELGLKGREGVFPAVVNELDRAGVDVRAAEGYKFGDHRRTTDPARVLGVTEHGQLATYYDGASVGRIVVRTSPLPAPEERELRQLEARAITALERAGNLASLDRLHLMEVDELVAEAPTLSQLDAQRLVDLSRNAYANGCRCALVELEPETILEPSFGAP